MFIVSKVATAAFLLSVSKITCAAKREGKLTLRGMRQRLRVSGVPKDS